MSDTKYCVHEHSSYSSAFDKYWHFESLESAQKFMKLMVDAYASGEFYDFDVHDDASLYDDFYDLEEQNYLRLSQCSAPDFDE